MIDLALSERARSRIGLLLSGVILGLIGLGSAAAELIPSAQQTEQQIKQLQGDIGALEKKLRSTRGEYRQLTQALRSSETEGAALSGQIADNNRKITQQTQQIVVLDGERQQLQSRRDLQLAALAAQASAAYRAGRQERLRLLLNQQQPEQVARMWRYHQYLSDARSSVLAELEQTLGGVERVELRLQQQRQQLDVEQQQLQSGAKALQQSRQQRQQALAAMAQQVQNQSQSLRHLKEDQQRLKRVLEELQQVLALNELQVTTQAFAKLKGQLPWPTATTQVVKLFGSDSSQGIRRDGMLIRAQMGERVNAIHNGRVVFSDWMRGYGMLLILDHGDGYMSLYGHNQSLLKQVGDWVAAGVQIARAGDSGGQPQAGLYFAIRYQGEPINPKAWLKRG